jgi:cation transport ATPase
VVDESLLTGESDSVPKAAGDEILRSIVVAGSGTSR